MRIGVFDSGIGGINVLKELMKKYPKEEYLYYGDTLHLPYGEKTKEQLIQLGSDIIRFFESEKVDIIVIACGTCSCLAQEFQKVSSVPIYDVIQPTVKVVKEKYDKVALLATEATIKSGKFQKALEQENISVTPLACPHFVPYLEGLVEEELDVQKELESLKGEKLEAVILGCTHFPLLKEKIEKILLVPSIDMGICLSEKILIDSHSTPSLKIYMSKVTPKLEESVSEILNQEVVLIEKILSE